MRITNKLVFVVMSLFFILPVFGEDNDGLNVKVENLEKAIDAEANYMNEVSNKLSTLQADKKALTVRVDQLNAALSEKEKTIKDLEAAKNNPAVDQALSQEKERLQKELEVSKKEVADLTEKLTSATKPANTEAKSDDETAALKKEKEGMENVLKEKYAEINALKEKLAVAQAAPKTDDAEKVKQELNLQLVAKDDQLKKLQDDIVQLKKDLESKVAQGKENSELVAQVTALKQELDTAGGERKKVEAKLNMRDSEIEGLKDKLSHSEDPVKEIKEKLREALADKSNLEDQLAKVQKRLENQDKEESSTQQLKEEKRDLEKKLKDLDNQLEDSKSRIGELEKELNKKEALKSADDNEAKKLRDEIVDKEKAINELERKITAQSALIEAEAKHINVEAKPDEKLLRELEEKDREIYSLKVVIKKAIERINALTGMPLPVETGSSGR